jgi:hypothetical protein
VNYVAYELDPHDYERVRPLFRGLDYPLTPSGLNKYKEILYI